MDGDGAVLVAGGAAKIEAVTARFPSAQFPGPPGVSIDVPGTWSPLAPTAYLRLDGPVDLAVVGPDEVDGVRPSLIVAVSRTLPSADPRALLEAVAATYGSVGPGAGSGGPVPVGSFAPAGGDAAAAGHLSHAVGHDERDGDRLVRRHRLTVYVQGAAMAHVVSVVGSASVTDSVGREQVVGMLRSVRIVAPWAPDPGGPAAGRQGAGGDRP